MREQNKISHELFGSESNACLIVILFPQLTVALSKTLPSQSFLISEGTFTDIGYGDWNGFYDWLRNKDGKLIGIRYWPFKEREFIFDILPSYSYMKVFPKKCLEIYLSEEREYDEKLSKDQEFGNDILFSSRNKDYAITFSTKLLKDDDINTILSIDANRREISTIA